MVARLRDVDREHPGALDSLLAASLFVGAVLSSAIPGPNDRAPGLTLYLLLALGTLPYAWRRRAPLAVLGLASIPAIAMTALGYSTAVIGAGLFLAAYTVAAWSRTRVVAVAAGFVVALIVAVVLVTPQSVPFGELATNAALFIGAFALGRSAHDRRRTLALLRERAELAERAQAEEAGRAVADERLRIARELHDVLASSLSVMIVQASLAEDLAEREPGRAAAAAEAVELAGRRALDELGGLLRRSGQALQPAGIEPRPGIADIATLAAEFRRAGLEVDLDVDAVPGTLPAGVELSTYRIVQEALTNVLKHAPGSMAAVRLACDGPAVAIEISNGPAAVRSDQPPSGHGLVGLRERVAHHGGHIVARPTENGGFRLTARLPAVPEAA